ncbi:putative DNA-binding domain-containing protein [Pseudomonas aeruginosa]|uniref:HvfC family RiPP maturation protein n=1 Tax=Pseudomonas aeruginosa TaxID=287 RepID=UPI00287BE09D|nr:putative DNA-binding domain-containing protein [Pseudomonas aeruginosa]MDS9916932.1 putative DNA-binding domain-containing protein [Pseudomonas aeruginosa]
MDERLRQQQFSLARHLRDPLGNAPPPDIEERRLRVYRELFYNAIEGLLASGFPRLRGLLGEQQWHGLVREFYREERSHTPLFTRIAGGFVDYLRQRGEYRPAWQAELAHFEWSETRLYLAEPDDPPYRREGDLLDGGPLLSSLALPLGYRWPVHRLEEDVALAEAPAEPTLLLMHRDSSHRVHTARLTPLAYRLLESLARRRLSGREHLAALALEARSAPGALDAAGLELLAALRTQGVVLGTLERDWAGG